MLNFRVQDERCTRCGTCVRECPAHIIQLIGDHPPQIAPENEEKCMKCQHCLALCPTAALSIFGVDPDSCLPLTPAALPDLDQMERLARGRRSIRQYRDETVDSGLLNRLLRILANVPTGVNQQRLHIHILDDKEGMERFRRQSLAAAAAAIQAGDLPEQHSFLQRVTEGYFEDGRDIIFRGAPHLIVISEPLDAACPPQDVALALAYFELLAQSAGLGTCWCGLLKLLTEGLPQIKEQLGIPADHEYYAMLFGYPAIAFARTVQRDHAASVRRIAVPV